MSKFKLSEQFLEKYKKVKPPFGFNGLGELVYLRTYSRVKENGENEQWYETVARVVEGTFNMQKNHIEAYNLGWNSHKAQYSAQDMYERMFHFKFLPPGRGLWAMGSAITEERKLFAALNNCAFISTENIKDDPSKPFCFLMDASMLGVGVGFDTNGAEKIIIKGINKRLKKQIFQIPDTREGWVEATKLLLESYFYGLNDWEFDYSLIRKAGEPIKGFGGISSGPEPLVMLHKQIREVLERNEDKPISITTIVDLMNMIGVCVVSGNVRRTAEISFGHYNSEEYLDLKNYNINPQRANYGWTSNNSIFADLGMDYSKAATRTSINGEPGYAWLENMQSYSRMSDSGKNYLDHRVKGGNPCFYGDTLIATADGRGAVKIKQLADEGKDVPVYSVNSEGKIEIKWGRNPRKTQDSVKLIEIMLDDNTSLKVTPTHKMRLINGETVLAKDLKKGDSLPRFTKRKEKIKKNGQDYWRVETNTLDHQLDKIMEHRLIAKFFDEKTYNDLYDLNKSNGWIKGGLVVHHKDYNGLNNSPDNLKWMTFQEHTKLHGDYDRAGINNGMYGKVHSEDTKAKIGVQTKLRCESEEYIQKLSESHSIKEREQSSLRLKEKRQEELTAYYIEQEKNTDLKTIWKNNRLFAIRDCIICKEEMILPWARRHAVFCSTSCANKKEESIRYRKEGIRTTFANKQQDTLHNQIVVFKDLVEILGREPLKKEWETECKLRKVSYRLRPNSVSVNPYILRNYEELKDKSLVYNHRVKEIRDVEGRHDVYNLTVDDNYTVAICTQVTDKQLDGIITFQCLEQSLESAEMCCLVETFPYNHETLEDFLLTLKQAYLYAKTVTLGQTHWPDTNRVLLRNRRIGCSMSGIAQFVAKRGLHEFKRWCEEGYKKIEHYDEIYSDWLAIPKSIKKTSIKPSGTVSLLAGATPGLHWPESNYYIRRFRLSITSDLIEPLKKAGYKVEPDVTAPEHTLVVEVPVFVEGVRTVNEVSMWEQLSMAAFLQKYWADNQVSCTVTFNPEKEGSQIKEALNYFQYQLKGISFLPKAEKGAYAQMPYEEITEEKYQEIVKGIKHVNFKKIKNELADVEKFCNNDKCEIPRNN